jgi:hypothetical protein
MSSIGVLINHDRESLLQIISWVEDHLLEEKVMEENAMHAAIAAIRKAQYGKA